jgi:hypothetical protein
MRFGALHPREALVLRGSGLHLDHVGVLALVGEGH